MVRAAGSSVLFVSHWASRSGASIALLRFLRWFKTNGNRPFSILLPSDGELTPAFTELAETWSIDRGRGRPGRLPTSVLNRVGLGAWAQRYETADIRRFAARCSPGLIYVNSIASTHAINLLGLQVPILTHVHELEYWFRLTAGPALTGLLAQTRQFIACSNAVKENLIRKHGIAPDSIETIHESIPIDQIRAERKRQEVFEELRVPEGAAIVIGGGTDSWRKGADLFLQLACLVCKQHSDVYFVWVGGSRDDLWRIDHDVHLAGLRDKVRLTGMVARVSDYFAAADVFVLTSREDPYPLVCLEAAALEKPIVCFDNAGGMPEFVESDCGFIVPYLDIAAMADRVAFLLHSSEYRLRMGAAARRKVEHRHDISVAGPRIMEIIDRAIRPRG